MQGLSRPVLALWMGGGFTHAWSQPNEQQANTATPPIHQQDQRVIRYAAINFGNETPQSPAVTINVYR